MSLILKFAAFFAMVGFSISLIFGLLGGNRVVSLLLTALISAVISGTMGAVVFYILNAQIPEAFGLLQKKREPPIPSGREPLNEASGASGISGASGLLDIGEPSSASIEMDRGGPLAGGEKAAGSAEAAAVAKEAHNPADNPADRATETRVELYKDPARPNPLERMGLKNEPKLLAKAVRTMILKGD